MLSDASITSPELKAESCFQLNNKKTSYVILLVVDYVHYDNKKVLFDEAFSIL